MVRNQHANSACLEFLHKIANVGDRNRVNSGKGLVEEHEVGWAKEHFREGVAVALAAAAGLGIPAQNFVVGDRSGRIGWTIAGPIPSFVPGKRSRTASAITCAAEWRMT